jgi:MraZ protein
MTGRALRQHGPSLRSGDEGQEWRGVSRPFRGESVHKVDQKGRVSVPAQFRRALEEGDPDWAPGQNPTFVLIYGIPGSDCLEGYTVEGANRLNDKVARMPSFSQARKLLERLLNTQSVQAQVDENGRIVLSQRLRDKFGLDAEAYFAGMGTHFQIWSPTAYAADMAAIEASPDEIASAFAELDAMDRGDGA